MARFEFLVPSALALAIHAEDREEALETARAYIERFSRDGVHSVDSAVPLFAERNWRDALRAPHQPGLFPDEESTW